VQGRGDVGLGMEEHREIATADQWKVRAGRGGRDRGQVKAGGGGRNWGRCIRAARVGGSGDT
jgi:hypothetical protein